MKRDSQTAEHDGLKPDYIFIEREAHFREPQYNVFHLTKHIVSPCNAYCFGGWKDTCQQSAEYLKVTETYFHPPQKLRREKEQHCGINSKQGSKADKHTRHKQDKNNIL